MADDITLDDLVCAFRLELRDGLLRLDNLGRTLADFENTAGGRFANLRQRADLETATLADRVLANLGRMAAKAGAFLAATFGVAAIASAVKRLGDAFIEENDKMDTFVARLLQVSGSSEQARASMEWLEQFSLTTKAGITDLVDAFVLLKNRGVTDVQGTMEGIRAASKAMGKSFTETATAVTSATMDAGRGLKAYGVEMKLVGTNVVLDYTEQSGKLVKKIIANNDELITSTLGAIFSDKYKTAAGESIRTWSEMRDAIKKEWGMLLEDVGKAGVWNEAKVQLGAFGAELRKLFTDQAAGQAWAKATSDALTPVVTVLGSTARILLELPLAFAMSLAAFKVSAADITVVWDQVKLTVQKSALALAETLDKLPFTNMKGALAGLHASISETYKDLNAAQAAATANAGAVLTDAAALSTLQDAGHRAAEGLRAAGQAGRTEGKGGIDEATRAANAAAAALDTLKAKYGLTFRSEVAASLGQFESDFRVAVAAGIPAEQLVARMGGKAKELQAQAVEFHLPVTQGLEDIFAALQSGTAATDNLAFYITSALPEAAKRAAGAVQVSVTEAGTKIENEAGSALARVMAAMPRLVSGSTDAIARTLADGVGGGVEAGVSRGQAAINTLARNRITIQVDISDMDLAAKLSRLGYTPKGMGDFAGSTHGG
jgi:hypothetical protein